VQSLAFRRPVERYAPRGNIVYYPNSVTPPPPTAAGADPLPAELVALLESNFCVLFAGNLGAAQAVETLVDAASEACAIWSAAGWCSPAPAVMLEWVFCASARTPLGPLPPVTTSWLPRENAFR
jgi:hypothetical protein